MHNQCSDWPTPPAAAVPGQARFRELLVPRVLAFESFRKAIEAGPGADAALRDVAALAHKIAGAAEVVGYPNAGEFSAALETSILRGFAAGATVAGTWREAAPLFERLLDEMECILDA